MSILTNKKMKRALREDRLEILSTLHELQEEAPSLRWYGLAIMSNKMKHWITKKSMAWLRDNGFVEEHGTGSGWRITNDGMEVLKYKKSITYDLG